MLLQRLIVFSIWQFFTFLVLSVNGAHISPPKTPYCNDVLGDDNGFISLVPSRKTNRGGSPLGRTYYDVLHYATNNNNNIKNVAECDIFENEHALRLSFKRIEEISEVFISEEKLIARFLNVSLRVGDASRECKLSGNVAVSLSKYEQTYAVFTCGAGYGSLPMAHELRINSKVHRTVSLTNDNQQQTEGSHLIDWLIVTQADEKSDANGNNAKENEYVNKNTDGCPPIDPYRGMPERYRDYLLVMNGAINELILKIPCKEGYKFIGPPLINQCKMDGTWQGSGFPECEVIKTKTPPDVPHANWSYVYKNAYHEIAYTCQDGYFLTGNGKVAYNLENDDWIDVPTCQMATEYFMENYWRVILGAVVSLVFVALLVIIIQKSVVIRKMRWRSDTQPSKLLRNNQAGINEKPAETTTTVTPPLPVLGGHARLLPHRDSVDANYVNPSAGGFPCREDGDGYAATMNDVRRPLTYGQNWHEYEKIRKN